MSFASPASLRPALAVTLVLAPAACGDAVATSATDTQTSSSSTTGSGPTTGGSDPTTSTTGTTGTTGGMSESSGSTSTGSSSDPTTGTSTTGVSATDSTSTTGTTDTTSTGTDTTDTGTTGDTEGPPKSCLAADFPVKAPLCGDGGPVCVMLADELVSAKWAFRNDMPAIALRGDCGPAVLFSEAVGGYFGFYAERTGADMWAVESVPTSIATGSLEFDPATDDAIAAVDDGAFGVSLWTRSGGQWSLESALAGQNHTRAPQLVRDVQGVLHLGHINADNDAVYERYDGAWWTVPALTDAEIHVRMALDEVFSPRLTAWSSAQDATWKLFFVVPPGITEVVTPLGSNVLDRAHHGLVLVGALETPWVLLARKQADQLHHDIILAHRTGNNAWSLETLVAEDPGADKTCGLPPDSPGQQCMYDYVRNHPLTLLASFDELRAVYLAVRHQGTLVSQCQDFPFPQCHWAPLSDDSTSELRVAWPGSQLQDHQVAAVDVFTDRATGRLDSAGQMHLAFYDYPPAGGDPAVRYMLIGP